jgi:hypothetical protein
MKSRILPPLESPDAPYAFESRKPGPENREPKYKPSLTPPSWPAESAPETAVERRVARAERLLEDITAREQALATQLKEHCHSVAQLAEERALFDAERINHAKNVKSAEEALTRMREKLALDSQALEERQKGGAGQSHAAENSDAAPLLSRLAKQAADFSSLVQTVSELQRQLDEERAGREERARSQRDQFRQREEALLQRESEADKRIKQLAADGDRLACAQEEFVLAKKENAELQLKLETGEKNLIAREKVLEEKRRDFDERLRNFRESFSKLIE